MLVQAGLSFSGLSYGKWLVVNERAIYCFYLDMALALKCAHCINSTSTCHRVWQSDSLRLICTDRLPAFVSAYLIPCAVMQPGCLKKVAYELMRRAMRVLIDLGTDGEAHHVACCFPPVLYMAADALMAKDEKLALFAVDTLSACSAKGVDGGPVHAEIMSSNSSSLLRQFAFQGMYRSSYSFYQRILKFGVW